MVSHLGLIVGMNHPEPQLWILVHVGRLSLPDVLERRTHIGCMAARQVDDHECLFDARGQLPESFVAGAQRFFRVLVLCNVEHSRENRSPLVPID